MEVFGYQFYLNGKLAAWSETFYPTREALREDMQRSVLQICQNINNNQKEGSGFRWWDNFVPDNPDSCYDKEEYDDARSSFNQIRHMVSPNGCSKIYEGVTDAANELENHCPYEISWHIVPYKVEVPKLVFGQIIAVDVGNAGKYRIPHLSAAYPDTLESRKQVIEDLVKCLRNIDEINEDDFRAGLEESGVVSWQQDHCGVITVFEANILTTEFNIPDQDDAIEGTKHKL